MINQNLKNKFNKKKKIIAYWITNYDLTTLEIVLKLNKFDCFVVDMEHSSISYGELEKIISLVDAFKNTVLVRIEKNDGKHISKILDLGSSGIIAPNINSKKELKLLINSIFYPPKGNRGVGLSRSSNHGISIDKYYKNFNKSVSIIPMIENVKALSELNEICSNKDIDGILIGPYDLSASLNMVGKTNSPKFKRIIQDILSAAKKNNLSCGIHLVHLRDQKKLKNLQSKFNFIPFSTDIQIFIDGLKEKIKILDN